MRQIIRKSSIPNIFTLFWVDNNGDKVENSDITMDFNPVLNELGGYNNLCILHYQARPKNLRRFGILCQGEYYATNNTVKALTPSIAVCLDESTLKLPPNAVIAYPNSKYIPENNTIASI